MNLIISGHGRMGKAVEAIALQRNHTILAAMDRQEDWERLPDLATKTPVVIDFSQPQAVLDNILRCFRYHLPVVVGTTGWDSDRNKALDICKKENQTLLTASNFSLGVNLFFAVNGYLASIMNEHTAYDVRIEETHHIHKLDKPSGTAKTLALKILGALDRKQDWTLEKSHSPEKIGMTSVRVGEIFGDHKVIWESDSDLLELNHSAKSRQGFALGAVIAAEWVAGKTGIFGMEDVLGL